MKRATNFWLRRRAVLPSLLILGVLSLTFLTGCPILPPPPPPSTVDVPAIPPTDQSSKSAPTVQVKTGQSVAASAGGVVTTASGYELSLQPGDLTGDAVVALYEYQLDAAARSQGILAAFQLAIPGGEATLAKSAQVTVPLDKAVSAGSKLGLFLMDYPLDLGLQADQTTASFPIYTWIGDADVDSSGQRATATLVASNRRYVVREAAPSGQSGAAKVRQQAQAHGFPDLTSEQDESGAHGPVALLLIHGGFGHADAASGDAWSTFLDWVKSNSPSLQDRFHIFRYWNDSSSSLSTNALDLHYRIEQLPSEFRSKFNRFVIVAHSRGGLIARELMRLNDYRDRIAALITLGTPHHGSPFAIPPWAKYALHGGYQIVTVPPDPVWCVLHPSECGWHEYAVARNTLDLPTALYELGYESPPLWDLLPVFEDSPGGWALSWSNLDGSLPNVTVYRDASSLLRILHLDGGITVFDPAHTDLSADNPPEVRDAIRAAQQLANADTASLRAKYVCYGTFRESSVCDRSFVCWLVTQLLMQIPPYGPSPQAIWQMLANGPKDGVFHLCLRLFDGKLATFPDGRSVTIYGANDGVVPVTSSLYLQNAAPAPLATVQGWMQGKQSGDRLYLADNWVGRRRLFFGLDHLDLVKDAGVFAKIEADLLELVPPASGQNRPPVANDQSVTVPFNTPTPITLSASDPDSGPQALTYSVVTPPSHGGLTGSAPSLTYTSSPGYSGPDSFTFKANDGAADSNVATVSITVLGPQQGGHFTLGPMIWDDTGGDHDGVMEAGEQVSVRIRLDSSASVQNVNGVLSTTDPQIAITSPNITWDDFIGASSQWSSWSHMALNFSLAPGQTRDAAFSLHVSYRDNGQLHQVDLGPFAKRFYADGGCIHTFVVDGPPFLNDDPSTYPGNDGSQTVESGENIYVNFKVCNQGPVVARRVDVHISTTNPGVWTPQNHEIRYPDMNPGDCGWPLDGRTWAIDVQRGFAGQVLFDVHLRLNESPLECVIPSGLVLLVGTAPWLGLGSYDWDFGVVAPGQDVTYTLVVRNDGTAALNVTNIRTLDGNGAPVSDTDVAPRVFLVQPGSQPQNVQVTIHTNNIPDGSEVVRRIVVESNGRCEEPEVRDRLTIHGIVSSAPPPTKVPGTGTGCDSPDVFGSLITWASGGGILGYDTASGTPYTFVAAPGIRNGPRASSAIVAWQEGNAPCDVFAFRRANSQIVPVAVTAADERLVGVDGDYVAYARTEYVLSDAAKVVNLFVYNTATGVDTRVTNYTPSGQNPVRSVIWDESDFGGGILAWRELTFEWKGSYWGGQSGGYRIQKLQPGVDPQPVPLVNEPTGPVSANGGRIAWAQEDVRTTNLPAQQDSWFERYRDGSGGDTENHGTDVDLFVKAPYTDPHSIIRCTLMQFDLSPAMPYLPGAVIKAARLHVYVRQRDGSGFPFIAIRRVTTGWTEYQVTGETRPGVSGDSVGDDTYYWETGWRTREIPTAWVRTWAEGANYGLELDPLLQYNGQTWQIARMQIDARDHGAGATAAYMDVTYQVPSSRQWWVWKQGQLTQLTQAVVDRKDPVLADAIIVAELPQGNLHDKLFYWRFVGDAINENEPRLLVSMASRSAWRADGNTVVWWASDGIYYARPN